MKIFAPVVKWISQQPPKLRVQVRFLAGALFALSPLALGFSGCATWRAPQPEAQTEFVFDAPYDPVWKALTQRATDWSWPIVVLDKSSGTITTDAMFMGNELEGYRAVKRVAYEPARGPHSRYSWQGGARLKISVLVSKLGAAQTKVKLNLLYEVYEDKVTYQWHSWKSNGMNEDQIVRYIRKRI